MSRPRSVTTSVSTTARVGTSGFSYTDWRGIFYPEGLPAREWLRHYSAHFNTVEINLTFYRSPAAAMLTRWREIVPADFVFVLKASKLITHNRKLAHCDVEIERMWESFSPLGARLGCVLFQLPPSLRADRERLEQFAERAQRSLEDTSLRTRFAFEFRHPSWYSRGMLESLNDRGQALVIHDMIRAGGWEVKGRSLVADGFSILVQDFLALCPFVYLRFHGLSGRYAGEYGAGGLRPWVALARSALKQGLDVHAYFNNDVGGAAVRDAARFGQKLAGRAPRPSPLSPRS